MKVLYPILAVGVAFALFYFYIDPTYTNIKVERERLSTLESSLEKTAQLTEERDALISKRDNIPPNDVARLEKLLPDHVDNIRLVLDISKMAESHLMRLRNMSIDDANQNANALTSTDQNAVESLVLSFSVSGTYATLRAFVRDLEQSLRIVDIESMRLSATDSGIYELNIAMRTFWVKP